MNDAEFYIDIIGNSYASHYRNIWSAYGKKTRPSWNWAAFLFSPAWWFYKKLYFEALIIIAAIFLSNIIVENISNLINTYGILYKIINVIFILFIAICGAKFADFRYFLKLNKVKKKLADEKSRKLYKRTQFLSLLFGVILFIAAHEGIDRLFEYNKLYFFSDRKFTNLLLQNTRENFIAEINELNFSHEKRGDGNNYRLNYEDNDISISEYGHIVSINMKYKSNEYFIKEIAPLIFLGKMRYCDLNYKWKYINGRSVSFRLNAGEIIILMDYI
ncbi:MAG: DUF2628 domain-containing protein [Treponema sp.]|jgi:hypothetical protein|nr:DUF2628 domain-containing protein [Treponema sp.]